MPENRARRRRFALAALLGLAACLSWELPASSSSRQIALRLGQTTLRLTVVGQPHPQNLVYFSPHGDEHTARQVCFRHIRRHGGCFVRLDNPGRRHLRFVAAGHSLQIDPNRMFTVTGAVGSLDLLNGPGWQADRAAVLAAVMAAGRRIAAVLEAGRAIVTVHNNRHDTARTFGKDPLVGRIHWPPGVTDTHNFFYVTQRNDACFLARRGFTVICQEAAKARTSEGDGSFSAYCGRKGIRYVCVEAGHGQHALQERMLKAARDCLQP